MTPRYLQRRHDIEALFVESSVVPSSRKVFMSPSGRYRLSTAEYLTAPHSWSYSRGIVTSVSDEAIVADVRRNYSRFWHAWVRHPNGSEYLLCGEDYQGYSVLNLCTGAYNAYFPEEAYGGVGLCWASSHPSPDGLVLAVEACIWAGPWQLVFYDFRDPEHLPLPILATIDDFWECKGWSDNCTVKITRAVDVRRADGAPYSSLSEAEQEPLDRDGSLIDTRYEETLIPRPSAAA